MSEIPNDERLSVQIPDSQFSVGKGSRGSSALKMIFFRMKNNFQAYPVSLEPVGIHSFDSIRFLMVPYI